MIAMKGNDCILLATDTRFSSYRTGTFLLGEYPRIVHRIGTRALVACIGLDSDIRDLFEEVKVKFENHLDDELAPNSIARVISNTLYRSRRIVTPLIVGIGNDRKGYICSTDSLGAQTEPEGFAVCGSASPGLYSICESEYQPGLDANELFLVMERALKLALQRDVLSGGACRVYVLRGDGGMEVRGVLTDDV